MSIDKLTSLERKDDMRYFRNIDSMDVTIMSLDDLRAEYIRLAREEAPEYDETSFSDFIENCLLKNNGSLVEIPQKNVTRSEIASCIYECVICERNKEKLGVWSDVVWDVNYGILDADDRNFLTYTIELQEYKIERGIK